MMRRGRLLAAMAMAGAVLLSGCGDSEDTDVASEESGTDASGPSTTLGRAPAEEPDPGGPDPDDAGDVGPPIDASTGGPDACAIAETLDLDGLLGEPPAPSDTRAAQGDAVCLVKAADAGSKATVKLVIETGTGSESYAEAKSDLGTDTEPDGLGDEAFHVGNHLFVLTGDTVVLVQVERGSIKVPSVEDAALEEAATVILEALDE
jgi:hypothetical protein